MRKEKGDTMDSKPLGKCAAKSACISGQRRISRTYLFIKRVMDIAFSSLGLIICTPLFIGVGIAIKRDSPGPVIFKQQRVGKDGKKFTMYKFRTMVVNAEEILRKLPEDQLREFKENFKFKDDPRITKVGKFLRKTSLDELPQLINIIKGDMSIVGPRPIVDDEWEKYGEYAQTVFSIKPGLTGMWQANGRSDTDYDERIELDMRYIMQCSIWLDIGIICKTAAAVLRKDGAY